MSSFAETMRRLRFERHMTQEEFADLFGTTKQNISRYESGAVSPKISTAQAYADKLGITLSELNGEIAPADAADKLHSLGEQMTSPSRSKEWRMLSEGLAEFEKRNSAAFRATFDFLTTTYPEIFAERTDADDAEP